MHGALGFRRDLARHGNLDASRTRWFMTSRCALALLGEAVLIGTYQKGD